MMAASVHLTWDLFAKTVADVADRNVDALRPETLVVTDLDMDSLAIAELVAAQIAAH